MTCQPNIQPIIKSCYWHIVHFKIIVILNGKIMDRTPIETLVTDCANIWSLPNLFLKMFDPIIKQNFSFFFFSRFSGLSCWRFSLTGFSVYICLRYWQIWFLKLSDLSSFNV